MFKRKGIEVIVFDYDVEGAQEDGPRIAKDPDGHAYCVLEWPSSGWVIGNEHWPTIERAAGQIQDQEQLEASMARGGFVVLAHNRHDPNPEAPLEAWAYRGQSATPLAFGQGKTYERPWRDSPQDTLNEPSAPSRGPAVRIFPGRAQWASTCRLAHMPLPLASGGTRAGRSSPGSRPRSGHAVELSNSGTGNTRDLMWL